MGISPNMSSKIMVLTLFLSAAFKVIPLCAGDSISQPLIISLDDIDASSSSHSQSGQRYANDRSRRPEIDENGCFLTTAKLVDAVDDYVAGGKNSEAYER